jgi:phage shock protein A
MNLFSRLSEILAPNEPCDKGQDLECVFARNGREMEQDLLGVKRYAAAVVAVERSLARELKQCRARSEFWHQKAHQFLAAGQENLAHRALVRKIEQDESVCRLEIDYRAALENRERVEETLQSLATWVAEVGRQQRSILAWQRAAVARRGLQHRSAAETIGGDILRTRLRRLIADLTEFEEELKEQAKANEDQLFS